VSLCQPACGRAVRMRPGLAGYQSEGCGQGGSTPDGAGIDSMAPPLSCDDGGWQTPSERADETRLTAGTGRQSASQLRQSRTRERHPRPGGERADGQGRRATPGGGGPQAQRPVPRAARRGGGRDGDQGLRRADIAELTGLTFRDIAAAVKAARADPSRTAPDVMDSGDGARAGADSAGNMPVGPPQGKSGRAYR
jgi:hypothetical protein